MKPYKICIGVGSRANKGRLWMVAEEIKKHPEFELQIIAFASASNMDFEIEPNFRVETLMFSDTHEAMALTAGVTLVKITDVLKTLKPDLMILHADRYEVLPVAMACAYMNIPIGHSEGGDHTGTIDQKVRYAISAFADIHFPVTIEAFDRLQRMGCHHACVVGGTGIDLVRKVIEENPVLPSEGEPYILVVHHPNTTHPEDIGEMVEALNEIPIKKVWVAPNVDAGSKEMLKLLHNQDYEFRNHVSPEHFICLMAECACMVGNTSSGIKEGAYLGIPYVCVGNRQDGREHGENVKFVHYSKQLILEEILRAIKKHRFAPDYRFGDGHASEKIVKYILRMREGK